MVVEINKCEYSEVKESDSVSQIKQAEDVVVLSDATKREKCPVKVPLDLDEIVTASENSQDKYDQLATKHQVEEMRVDVSSSSPAGGDKDKSKGFSIQRAWCCLRNRRTS